MSESGHTFIALQDKLNANKKIVGDCWLWTGNCDPTGYGRVWHKGSKLRVHRASFCLYNGISLEESENLVLHIVDCPNKNCFNPVHLYLGDQKQNAADVLKTGNNANKNKTHCKYGHEYTIENTRIDKKGRSCRICLKLNKKAFDKRKRAGAIVGHALTDIERQVLDS
jgi:hypothetical protein